MLKGYLARSQLSNCGTRLAIVKIKLGYYEGGHTEGYSSVGYY